MIKRVGIARRSSRATVASWSVAAGLLVSGGALASSDAATASAAARSHAARSHAVARAAAGKHLKLAFMSFAVANSYDAPMLAAAKAAAAAGNASLTVFDANNNPATQYTQLQDVITQGGYSGIITQPIESTNLIPLVQQAISKKIKVVNIDQILGPKLNTFAKQIAGLSGNVTFVPTEMGNNLGQLVVQACKAKHLNPCNVGYLYDIKASALDVAIHEGFDGAIKADPSIKIVAQGQDFFTPAGGLKATQDMLESAPSMNLICGSDQGIEGATQAVTGKKVALVGYGGSAAGDRGVKAGTWFGTVAQDPATEGRLGVEELVSAVRTGLSSPAVNPLDSLPDGGVITKADVSLFKSEWPG